MFRFKAIAAIDLGSLGSTLGVAAGLGVDEGVAGAPPAAAAVDFVLLSMVASNSAILDLRSVNSVLHRDSAFLTRMSSS